MIEKAVKLSLGTAAAGVIASGVTLGVVAAFVYSARERAKCLIFG